MGRVVSPLFWTSWTILVRPEARTGAGNVIGDEFGGGRADKFGEDGRDEFGGGGEASSS